MVVNGICFSYEHSYSRTYKINYTVFTTVISHKSELTYLISLDALTSCVMYVCVAFYEISAVDYNSK